jgi:hypothetical protein
LVQQLCGECYRSEFIDQEQCDRKRAAKPVDVYINLGRRPAMVCSACLDRAVHFGEIALNPLVDDPSGISQEQSGALPYE